MLRVYAVGPDGAKLHAEQEVAADARAKGARIGPPARARAGRLPLTTHSFAELT